MVCLSAQRVCQAVIGYINHNIEIIATYGLVDHTFRLAGSESRDVRLNNVAVFVVVFESNIVMMLMFAVLSPGCKIVVYFLTEFSAAGSRDQSQSTGWHGFQNSFIVWHDLSSIKCVTIFICNNL